MAEAIWAEREDLAKRLFTPRVSYVHGRSRQTPKFWPVQDLRHGNWLVIGTLIQRDFFLSLGGFNSRFHGYEDWELWLKAHLAGAKITKVPKAVYIAHVDPGSRNRGSSKEERVRWHYEIGREHCPEIYNEDWLSVHMPRARAGRR
jgi:GT2 family glycosyltransferase